uniref:Phospholipid-transporting ATPase n=1 Tax=Erpetoichthys calabaricus TaxID=27687 RepID=A0A8C4RLT1_ERPCA
MEEQPRWTRLPWQKLVSAEASLISEEPANRYCRTYFPSKSGGKCRTVLPCLGDACDDYGNISKSYMNNTIRTTKYTLLNFIPMNLFEQFHRAANLYFLFIVVLNWVPVVEAFQKEITMIPLIVVLTIIAIKDALEDYRRYKFDKQINNMTTKVYRRKHHMYIERCWKDVQVGDFIRLSCNEIIPADMVLLYSSDPDGICHIETSNLDGETNLKQRYVVKGFSEQDFEVNPEQFTSKIECESPNNDLTRFRGFMEHNSRDRVGLHKENLLLRGCTVKNTETVVGIVVYAGHETKAMLNNTGPRYKRSKLERRLNGDILWSVVLLLLMCLTTAIGKTVTQINIVLIPISLYVSIEIVKLGQIFFIQNDIDLYNEKLDSTIQCRALNITEDLGQIQYIFSDKTGTLTENKMVFLRCSIAGVEYSHEDNAKRLELYQDVDSDDMKYQPQISPSPQSALNVERKSLHDNQNCTSTNIQKSGYNQEGLKKQDVHCLRQVAFSSKMEKEVVPDPRLLKKFELLSSQNRSLNGFIGSNSHEIAYIMDFFLALAICNTVVVSSPTEPRQKAGIPCVGQTPLKSFEEIKQLFQKFSVQRFSSPLPNLNDQPSPSGSSSRLNIFNKIRTSAPTVVEEQESASESEKSNFEKENKSSCQEKSQKEMRSVDATFSFSVDPHCGLPVSGELNYEAESPDEAALVHAARAYKCTLRSRTPEHLTVDLFSVESLTFQLLHILPFDSVRKRMSVVVRHPYTNQIIVYTKGADSVIMDLLDGSSKGKQQKRIKEQTQKHLNDYAKDGLRTLCIAKKVNSFFEWLKDHFLAETSIDNREQLLLESALKLETDLILLGATGIVDRLQEGVPETIEALQKAGIKIWVLTGDKQETAVNIAYSCKLLRPSDKVFTLNCTSKDACEALISQILKNIEDNDSGTSVCQAPNYSLVIDGKTLEFTLQKSLEEMFLNLTIKCRAVVCCRSTPLQKSQVVKLVRDKLKVMSLAIGDGANDVSMIQVADVGIGISGQEGMQAVMSSDFAVSRFKHLSKLLLVHGHWCYTRLANMILYFFYKNLAFVNLLLWYQLFCGFSGSTMTDYWILIFFNLLFTSAPPIIYGILDKDVSAETLLQLPELYRNSQASETYNTSTFWWTMLDSFYQSLICFFVPYFPFSKENFLWTFCMTWIHAVILIGSALFYFVFALVFGVTCVNCNSPSNTYWIMEKHMSDPVFYCGCILTTVLALLPRLAYHCIQNSVYPTLIVKAAQLDKLTPEERNREIEEWKFSQDACCLLDPVDFLTNPSVDDSVSLKECSIISASCSLPLNDSFSMSIEDLGDVSVTVSDGIGTQKSSLRETPADLPSAQLSQPDSDSVITNC